MTNIVFISYAREDKRHAERLYMDLRKANINAWLDTKCLQPGQNWKKEVTKTIKDCAFFIALISEASLNKRGYVQSEMRIAFDILKETPSNQIFIIPVKLDKSIPYDEELLNLNWVDLYESYDLGLERILSVIDKVEKEPLIYYDSTKPYGKRAPIRYSPFSNFEEFVLDILNKFPTSVEFYDYNKHSFFITFLTSKEGVDMPHYLREKYPIEITLVFQYNFKNLQVKADYFSVDLEFNGVPETIKIPYNTVTKISIPSIDLLIYRLPKD